MSIVGAGGDQNVKGQEEESPTKMEDDDGEGKDVPYVEVVVRIRV